jgi:hypothetical protein
MIDDFYFTSHARRRITEEGLSIQAVGEALRGEHSTKAHQDTRRTEHLVKIDGRLIKVVTGGFSEARAGESIVTVMSYPPERSRANAKAKRQVEGQIRAVASGGRRGPKRKKW